MLQLIVPAAHLHYIGENHGTKKKEGYTISDNKHGIIISNNELSVKMDGHQKSSSEKHIHLLQVRLILMFNQ